MESTSPSRSPARACANASACSLLVALLAASCAGDERPDAQRRQAIYGGVPAPNDHAVFQLWAGGSTCSATLIAPRTLLTAGHCVDAPQLIAQSTSASPDVFTAVAVQSWNQAHADAGAADLALVLLDRGPKVTPMPWTWTLAGVGPGTPVRHVGYGLTEAGTSGERRTVVTTVNGFTSSVQYGRGISTGGTGVGICFGDSGGPLLVSIDGGPERVLGVHSYSLMCGPGTSISVPDYRAFLEGWLRTHEDAGCPRDDRCVAGCAPVDPDCVCGADGQCLAECEDLVDVDCPASCRPAPATCRWGSRICSPAPRCSW